MDGNFFNVLKGMHQQLHDCQCIKNKLPNCEECVAILAAMAELEAVPRFRAMSEGIEEAFFDLEPAA